MIHARMLAIPLIGYLAFALAGVGEFALCFGSDGHMDVAVAPHAEFGSGSTDVARHFHPAGAPYEIQHVSECVDVPVSVDGPTANLIPKDDGAIQPSRQLTPAAVVVAAPQASSRGALLGKQHVPLPPQHSLSAIRSTVLLI